MLLIGISEKNKKIYSKIDTIAFNGQHSINYSVQVRRSWFRWTILQNSNCRVPSNLRIAPGSPSVYKHALLSRLLFSFSFPKTTSRQVLSIFLDTVWFLSYWLPRMCYSDENMTEYVSSLRRRLHRAVWVRPCCSTKFSCLCSLRFFPTFCEVWDIEKTISLFFCHS